MCCHRNQGLLHSELKFLYRGVWNGQIARGDTISCYRCSSSMVVVHQGKLLLLLVVMHGSSVGDSCGGGGLWGLRDGCTE